MDRVMMSVPSEVSRLDALPYEILREVCSVLLGDETSVCFNIRVGSYGIPRMQQEQAEAISGLRTLLQSDGQLRAHALRWLAHPRRRTYARTENFILFQATFGHGNANLIQTLSLKISYNQKTCPEKEWPGFLKMLELDFPNLVALELSTIWRIGDPQYLDDSTEIDVSFTREEQETAMIQRLAAFVALRHPHLQRMIAPAESVRTYRGGETCSRTYVILDRGTPDESGHLPRAQKAAANWKREDRSVTTHCEVRLSDT